MSRPVHTQYTESMRTLVDLDEQTVGDILEVNPDYLVVVRRMEPTGQFFVPHDQVRPDGAGWLLNHQDDKAPWERWRDERIDSAFAPTDGERVLADAQRRAALERKLTRVVRDSQSS